VGKDLCKAGPGHTHPGNASALYSRIGPFKGLGFNNPTPQTEDLYIKSINTTVDRYRAFLEQVRAGTLVLPNCDLDSGNPTEAGEYSLTDETYASLLAKLSARNFDLTTTRLRGNILQFYSDPSLPIETKKYPARWQSVQTALSQLKSTPPSPAAANDLCDDPSHRSS